MERLFHWKFRLPKFENRGLRNWKHPLTVPLLSDCESRTTGTENDYATMIFQTSVTGIFGEVDTLLFYVTTRKTSNKNKEQKWEAPTPQKMETPN